MVSEKEIEAARQAIEAEMSPDGLGGWKNAGTAQEYAKAALEAAARVRSEEKDVVIAEKVKWIELTTNLINYSLSRNTEASIFNHDLDWALTEFKQALTEFKQALTT